MSIDISNPTQNSTVGLSFQVNGTYSLNSASSSSPSISPGTIVVGVYESDGSTPLPSTIISPSRIALPPGALGGQWQVSVICSTSYSAAVITAVLTPNGGTPATDSVAGVNVS